MKRAFTSDAVVTAPDYSDLVSDGYATAGNPQLGVPATLPGAAWFNLTQEEIVRVIEAMGLTPANAPQLLAALIAGRFPLGPHYAYDADTDYPVNAIALYSNKLYICLTANGPGSTVVTPGTDSSVWDQIPSLADIVSNINCRIGSLEISQ